MRISKFNRVAFILCTGLAFCGVQGVAIRASAQTVPSAAELAPVEPEARVDGGRIAGGVILVVLGGPSALVGVFASLGALLSGALSPGSSEAGMMAGVGLAGLAVGAAGLISGIWMLANARSYGDSSEARLPPVRLGVGPTAGEGASLVLSGSF